MKDHQGHQIVLTADRTLMAGHKLLFDGMLAASQTTIAPPSLTGLLLMPHAVALPGSSVARVAPLGLRRIEAALRDGGFDADAVAVVDERHLDHAIGAATRVVAISSGDPLGLGMNSSTMCAIAGGRPYSEALFRKVLGKARRRIAASGRNVKLVVGGPGAWQLASHPDALHALGIDHVVSGYAEGGIAELFRAIIQGEGVPEVIVGQDVSARSVPRIRGASTMGVVEISRGCGLGCSFCTIGRSPMRHLPVETIVADVETNVNSGNANVALLSEDFFRYGAEGVKARPQEVVRMLDAIRRVPGVRLIQIDHANVLSVAQFTDEELVDVRGRVVGTTGVRYPWVNVGIETASARLLRENGGTAKMGGLAAHWPDACAEQVRRLCRAGFFPMASLVIGLPGETADDVRATREWVRSLANERLSVFPMLHAPIDGHSPLGLRDLNVAHWRLIRECYAFNFKWIPRMYWDNQKGIGVSPGWRCLLQLLGRCQALQWKMLFAWHSLRAR